MRHRKSTLRLTAAFVAMAVLLYWPAIIFACAVDGATARQPYYAEAAQALQGAASGTLGTNYPSLPLMWKGNPPNDIKVPGSIPCVIIKAVAWTESSWRQA